MKFIPFAKHGPIESRTFLREMLETSPSGQTLGQMRERLKVLEAIKAAPPEGVTLEDAQQATLVSVLNSRADYAVTSADLIAIVDSVEKAQEPPPPAPPA